MGEKNSFMLEVVVQPLFYDLCEPVIISGGLSGAWELFMDKAISEARKRTLGAPMERVQIKKSTLVVTLDF